jgi:uncharacterized protein
MTRSNPQPSAAATRPLLNIGPDETDTLSYIPAEPLFPAPRLPRGHVVLGYDERGHCPMLIDDQCSIYEHRPRACRTYDCRIFPAAGLGIDDEDDKVLIARQVRRWRFGFPTQADRNQHDAVRAAASFLDEHKGLLPEGAVPNSTRLAVLAIEMHDTFLRREAESDHTTVVDPDPEVVRVGMLRRTGGQDAT